MSRRLRRRKKQDDNPEDDGEWLEKQKSHKLRKTDFCILRSTGLVEYGNFTSLETCGNKDTRGEKLENLLAIPDKRFKLPVNSLCRMRKHT